MGAPSNPSLGFRMPAEWEPHAATWLAWPHNPDTWFDRLDAMAPVWCEMVAALCPHETVHVIVNDASTRVQAVTALAGAGIDTSNVRFHLVPTNDAWIRDHGPTFVEDRNGELVILDWRYNAWGGKYPPWEDDDRVRVRIAEILGLRHHSPGFILEGGSLDVNGRGTLLTTDLCLLNPNRNPHLSRADVESALKECLGLSKVLWLSGGIHGDETDGHIDILARFVDPTTVLVMVEEDPKDENYEPLQDNYRRLGKMTDQDGRPLRVIPMSMPHSVHYKHLRLPASYANFYVANRVVLVPTYNDAKDRQAVELVGRLFPDRAVVGIHCSDLSIGGGAIHCVTQQQPAGPGGR